MRCTQEADSKICVIITYFLLTYSGSLLTLSLLVHSLSSFEADSRSPFLSILESKLKTNTEPRTPNQRTNHRIISVVTHQDINMNIGTSQ